MTPAIDDKVGRCRAGRGRRAVGGDDRRGQVGPQRLDDGERGRSAVEDSGRAGRDELRGAGRDATLALRGDHASQQ